MGPERTAGLAVPRTTGRAREDIMNPVPVRTDCKAEIRERVTAAMRDAVPGGLPCMADAAVDVLAGFAAELIDQLGDQVAGTGTDEREYGRALAFEESADLLRGLAGQAGS